MINILYIGNALSKEGKTTTTIETLGTKLSEFFNVKIASKKSNKISRLLDMVWAVIKNKKTDYVLIDTYSTTNFYYALIISQCCRVLKKKYIPILHGGNLENRLKHNPVLSKLIFNNAYKLIAPSRFLETVFKSYGYNNLMYIPNFIDIEEYDFRERDLQSLNLLWVRSFSSIYNPEQAISVLTLLRKKGYDSRLTMVGPEIDGSLEKIKNQIKESDLSVTLTGKLSKKDWVKLSEKHNIFINTTNIDNTPVSVMEAMALGIPVISTKVGGIPYLIENNEDGLLVPPKNADAMCNAIVQLASDNALRNAIVKNARSKVEHFDWNVVKSKWQLLLQ